MPPKKATEPKAPKRAVLKLEVHWDLNGEHAAGITDITAAAKEIIEKAQETATVKGEVFSIAGVEVVL